MKRQWGYEKEHPRVRGENGLLTATGWAQAGTSPRARGKLPVVATAYTFYRNIPACAGKTGFGCGSVMIAAEHPRVRGENLKKLQPHPENFGTSPRARGKLISAHGCHGKIRNIPACAGKTKPA